MKANDVEAERLQDDASAHLNFIWRDTLQDGMLPFNSVHDSYQEQMKVKESQKPSEIDTGLFQDFTSRESPFELRTVVYARQLG